MQASGVYNRYMNVIYDTDEEQQVMAASLQVPGAPKKAKKMVQKSADMHSRRLDFPVEKHMVCPGAPKKANKTFKISSDLQPQRIDFTVAFLCPGAPKKLKKTRTLSDCENVTPVKLVFTEQQQRTCPGAPKKAMKALARTPFAWNAFTEADIAWFHSAV